jgi:hypothetical protein
MYPIHGVGDTSGTGQGKADLILQENYPQSLHSTRVDMATSMQEDSQYPLVISDHPLELLSSEYPPI